MGAWVQVPSTVHPSTVHGCPSSQVPQLPPQPSLPHSLPSQSGVQHTLEAQTSPSAQAPHISPHPAASGPQFHPVAQTGMHPQSIGQLAGVSPSAHSPSPHVEGQSGPQQTRLSSFQLHTPSPQGPQSTAQLSGVSSPEHSPSPQGTLSVPTGHRPHRARHSPAGSSRSLALPDHTPRPHRDRSPRRSSLGSRRLRKHRLRKVFRSPRGTARATPSDCTLRPHNSRRSHAGDTPPNPGCRYPGSHTPHRHTVRNPRDTLRGFPLPRNSHCHRL